MLSWTGIWSRLWGYLCRRGWEVHPGPNLLGRDPGLATCAKRNKSEQNMFLSWFFNNLKSVKSSSKKAKESCTDKSTMVARNSDPGIFWFTQCYAGRNEKEESPYRWENCLGSMPGMVAKLGSTAKANCSEIKFCGETSARQGCAEAGEELMPRSRSRQWNCRT